MPALFRPQPMQNYARSLSFFGGRRSGGRRRFRVLNLTILAGVVATVALAAQVGLFPAPVHSAPANPAVAAVDSIALFPGSPLPLEGLAWFDEVIVDPTKVSDGELATLRARGTRVIAQVGGALAQKLGRGGVGDLEALGKKGGYAGFLFDARSDAHAPALETLALQMRQRSPGAAVYFRGPVTRLATVAPALSGYFAEGIFTAAMPEGEPTPPAMLDDLEGVRRLAALVEVRRRYTFPFLVLERVPVGHREQARGIARTLADRGFIPYVTVGGKGLGIGAREAMPRRILALYDGEEENEVASTVLHRLLAMPLEHFGYVVDYFDVRNPLPAGDLASRYAGIVSWFSDDDMPQPRTYELWLRTQLGNGLRFAIFGRPGFSATAGFLAQLGLVESTRKPQGPLAVQSYGKMIGLEARPNPLARGLLNWKAREAGEAGRDAGLEVHLELRDVTGRPMTPVVTGPWGGIALDPYVIDRGLEGRVRWIVDPFSFLSRALDLEPMPIADPTTENGRRLLFIQIDGDAFASMAEMPGKYFSGQIIKREFLDRYPFPTTVSIVEGETSAVGLYPQLSEKLEPIARDIFKLSNVEPASHGFAHPFDWVLAAKGVSGRIAGSKDAVYLPIPNYTYSAAREISGSIRYINERLAPPDKPARVFLWTGAALPGPDALKEIAAQRFFNMNGGNNELPLDAPALAMVPSYGRMNDGILQVYAQAHNENVYTNEWTGPFYGFRRVIDMFRFTETPRRLKPIDIYYHFYSGTKLAGVNALHDVYGYAEEQETLPIYVSEMVTKVEDFQRVSVARRLDGNWELRGFGALRTIRFDKRLGWPNVADSTGVVGVQDLPQGRYVSLAGNGPVVLAVQNNKPTVPHLVSANATLQSWSRERDTVRFRFKGHVPVEVTIGACTPAGAPGGARLRVDSGKRTARLNFSGLDTREVTVSCR
jgi:hypothetical protein